MKRFWIFIFFILIILTITGYVLWYEIFSRDHIIDFVPEDTVLYIHDAHGNSRELMKRVFPFTENLWPATNGEVAFVWEKSGERSLYTREQKKIIRHTEKQETQIILTASGVFKKRHLGYGLTGKNYGHFPLYGLIEENFAGNITPEFLPTHLPKTFFIHGRNKKVYFLVGENIPWGYTPLFDWRRKTTSSWLPLPTTMVLTNESLSLWNEKLGFLGSFGRIGELTEQEKFKNLAKPKIIAQEEALNKKGFWVLGWDIAHKDEVKQLVVQLAQETFPIKQAGETLPDGTKTEELKKRTDPFPAHETTASGISYTEYSKDDWELGVFERDQSVILTNMPKEFAKIFPLANAKTIFPRCGRQGEEIFFLKNKENWLKTLFLTRKNKTYYGCFEL